MGGGDKSNYHWSRGVILLIPISFPRSSIMFSSPITRDNLSLAVDETLSECLAQLRNASDSSLVRDLTVACEALQIIKDELSGVRPQRPKGQRSARFIRYAVDEDDQLAMDPRLKEVVVRIEDVYKRV
jgi:hypothetical protein